MDYTHYSQGVVVLGLDGAIMSEITNQKVDYPIDILTAGILAGMFTHFMRSDVDCVQTQLANWPRLRVCLCSLPANELRSSRPPSAEP